MMQSPDFLLASASPRRAELLQQIGARFLTTPVDIDETVLVGELPKDYVCRMAMEKAQVGWRAQETIDSKKLPALGADTAVVLDSKIFGKPDSESTAVEMLLALSETTHSVLSAVALCDGILHNGVLREGTMTAVRLSETRVTFRRLSEAECHRYWRTGEPADKAGAYGIQGMGAVFVTKVEGSYSAIVGLPISETCELFQQFDISWWQPQ